MKDQESREKQQDVREVQVGQWLMGNTAGTTTCQRSGSDEGNEGYGTEGERETTLSLAVGNLDTDPADLGYLFKWYG